MKKNLILMARTSVKEQERILAKLQNGVTPTQKEEIDLIKKHLQTVKEKLDSITESSEDGEINSIMNQIESITDKIDSIIDRDDSSSDGTDFPDSNFMRKDFIKDDFIKNDFIEDDFRDNIDSSTNGIFGTKKTEVRSNASGSVTPAKGNNLLKPLDEMKHGATIIHAIKLYNDDTTSKRTRIMALFFILTAGKLQVEMAGFEYNKRKNISMDNAIADMVNLLLNSDEHEICISFHKRSRVPKDKDNNLKANRPRKNGNRNTGLAAKDLKDLIESGFEEMDEDYHDKGSVSYKILEMFYQQRLEEVIDPKSTIKLDPKTTINFLYLLLRDNNTASVNMFMNNIKSLINRLTHHSKNHDPRSSTNPYDRVNDTLEEIKKYYAVLSFNKVASRFSPV